MMEGLHTTRRSRVLVADDTESVRSLFERLLKVLRTADHPWSGHLSLYVSPPVAAYSRGFKSIPTRNRSLSARFPMIRRRGGGSFRTSVGRATIWSPAAS